MSGTLQRAIGNSAALLISQIITWTATLIFMAALARGLGDEQFGVLFLAMSFATIALVFVEFGLDQLLVREIARDHSRAGSHLMTSLVLKTVSGVMSYLVIIALIDVLGYSRDVQLTIAIYCLVILLHGYSMSLTSVYKAVERLFHSAVATTIEKVAITAVGLVLLWQGANVIVIAGVYVFGALIATIWKYLFLRRKIDMRLEVDRGTLRTLAVGALPFFLYWSLASVYHRIDTIMLSRMVDGAVVGWYAAAYRLFDTLVFLPSIVVSAVMFPIVSRLAVESRDELRAAARAGLDVILLLGIPICTGLFVLAHPIIGFVYGDEFFRGAPALQWLAVALFVLYVNSVLGVLLMSVNKERVLSIVAVIAISVNLGLNFLLIPRYEHVAAAATTLATEVLIFGLFFAFLPKDILSLASLGVLARSGVAAALMVLVIYPLDDIHVIPRILIGAVVYGVAAIAVGAVPDRYLSRFKTAVLESVPVRAGDGG